MIDAIDRAYFEIIFEEDYSDDYWMKHGTFKGIDFYIRKDGHLEKRLKERYGEKSLNLECSTYCRDSLKKS